jgi:hypothetical protein
VRCCSAKRYPLTCTQRRSPQRRYRRSVCAELPASFLLEFYIAAAV